MEEQQAITTPGPVSEKAQVAGEKIERSAQRIEDEAIDRIQGLRARVETSVRDKRSQTVSRVQTVGSALRSASEQVQTDDPVVREVLEFASERADRVASYLSQVNFDDLRNDLVGLARRRPAAVAGGALLLGVVAGRALRAFAQAAAEEPRAEDEPATREVEPAAPLGSGPLGPEEVRHE